MAEYDYHRVSNEDFDGKLSYKIFKCKPAISLIQKYNTQGNTSSDQVNFGNKSICANIYATGKFGLYDRFDPDFVLIELDHSYGDRVVATLFRDTKKLLKHFMKSMTYEKKREYDYRKKKEIMGLFTFKGEPVSFDLMLKLTEKNREKKQHIIEFKMLR